MSKLIIGKVFKTTQGYAFWYEFLNKTRQIVQQKTKAAAKKDREKFIKDNPGAKIL